jgi:hypothetical protein
MLRRAANDEQQATSRHKRQQRGKNVSAAAHGFVIPCMSQIAPALRMRASLDMKQRRNSINMSGSP